MDERIGSGLHQSCGDRGSVGHVSVFGCGGVGGEWVGDLDMYLFMTDITNPDLFV